MKEFYVGIDVSKEKLDFAVRPSTVQGTLGNTDEGIRVGILGGVVRDRPDPLVGLHLAGALLAHTHGTCACLAT